MEWEYRDLAMIVPLGERLPKPGDKEIVEHRMTGKDLFVEILSIKYMEWRMTGKVGIAIKFSARCRDVTSEDERKAYKRRKKNLKLIK